jgi:arylsulfatase A-like enzyme
VTDVLPTLLEAVGATIPPDLDGSSQLASLESGTSEVPDYLIFGLIDGLAFYRWPYKLRGSEPPMLFNVIDDPTEQNNLAKKMPRKLAELQAALAEWNVSHKSDLALYDILFDPDDFGGEEDREPWADTVKP